MARKISREECARSLLPSQGRSRLYRPRWLAPMRDKQSRPAVKTVTRKSRHSYRGRRSSRNARFAFSLGPHLGPDFLHNSGHVFFRISMRIPAGSILGSLTQRCQRALGPVGAEGLAEELAHGTALILRDSLGLLRH